MLEVGILAWAAPAIELERKELEKGLGRNCKN